MRTYIGLCVHLERNTLRAFWDSATNLNFRACMFINKLQSFVPQ